MGTIHKHSVRLGLLFCFFLPVAVQAQNFLAFGDSITQGYPYITTPGNGARIGGYEPDLESLFASIGKKTSVYNWGVAGETTNSGLSRINGLCNTDGEYALILEGTNDFFHGISPETTAFNVVQIARQIQGCGKIPLVGTLTPDFRETGKSVETVNSYLAAAVSGAGIELVDLYGATVGNWGEYVTFDQLHPNPVGYHRIAETWFQTFLAIHVTTGRAESRQDSPYTVQAFLHGTITANGNVTGIRFEYGRTPALGSSIPASPGEGSGEEGLVVSAELKKLAFKTAYYYRIVADYGGKTHYGEIKSFRTPRRIIVIIPWLSLLLSK